MLLTSVMAFTQFNVWLSAANGDVKILDLATLDV